MTFRIALLFLWAASVLPPSAEAAVSRDVLQDWDRQYEELSAQKSITRRLDEGTWQIEGGQIRKYAGNPIITLDQLYDRHAMVLAEDGGPLDVVIRRTRALIDLLKATPDAPDISALEARFNQKAQSASGRQGYLDICAIRREIAFTNPLLDFDRILFCERGSSRDRDGGIGGHMVSQYNVYLPTGSGLYVLEDAFGDSPRRVDLVESAPVTNGPDQGKLLEELNRDFISPELSFDGQTVYFGWGYGTTQDRQEREQGFHLYRIGIDGSDLTQLTFGPYADWDPCCLPNGRLAFISTRRHGVGRCHPKYRPTYTLFSVKPDGSDLLCLSYHETNEWHPSVDNNGMIVYTRWDYVDRDSDIAHHMWVCTPDGRDPRAPHGNYPHSLTTIPDVPWYENPDRHGRGSRPWMENNFRALPGTSNEYVGVATPHHGRSVGSLIYVNTGIPDDGVMSQLRRITPHICFPEAEGQSAFGRHFATPWPLSKDFFLCTYHDGIYLLDRFGNMELLYRCTTGTDPSHPTSEDKYSKGRLQPMDPIPVTSRPTPPVLATKTWQGERAGLPGHSRAAISISNIYEADMPWPEGTEIKWLRIMQIIPKPASLPKNDRPRIGFADQGIARMSLGIVRVEEDGSVFCDAPVGACIYFQALDENKMAVQSMRSATYVHKGEHLSCFGCHEDKWKAIPPLPETPTALRRAPSPLTPDAGGLEPINYHRLVKPVLESTCIPCHRSKTDAGPTSSTYQDLKEYAFWFHGGGNGNINDPIAGGSRTIPGYFGAHYSKMGTALLSSHRDRITEEEFGRVCLWLDANSNELGAYHDTVAQRSGELVWPALDIDPGNLQAIEKDITAIRPDIAPRPEKGRAHESIDIREIGGVMVVEHRGSVGLEVFDSRGKCVARRAPGAARAATRLDFSSFPSGIYLLTVETAGGSVVRALHHF